MPDAIGMSNSTFDITPYVQGWKRRMAEAQQLMAARKKQAYADARNIAQFLRVQYGCNRVVGVGSTFNEKKFTERSDIDLVVWGLPSGKYFSISSEIGDLTSFGVDLIPAENARPLIMQLAEQEGGRVMRAFDQVTLRRILVKIHDVLNQLNELFSKWESHRVGDWADTIFRRGKASVFHDFYCGVENIFESIAPELNGELPNDPEWKTLLLHKM